MFKSIFIPLISSTLIYIIYNLRFEIPNELKGWVMMSIFTPIISMFINSYNIINMLKKFLLYFHTWNNQSTPELINWIDHYIKNNVVWSQESITETAKNKSIFWWNSYSADNRTQTREVPVGWCIIKYREGYILSYSSYPSITQFQYNNVMEKNITVYSLYKIDWIKFINDVKEYYYNDIVSSRMITYNCNSSRYSWDKVFVDLRQDVDKSYCFGNKAKEECWDAVLNFFDPKTKQRYRDLGQTYKTSFLIHGPPGTGKSELILLIASSLWKKLQIPVYMLNPNGLSDVMLQSIINEISTGIVVVNEFDMGIQLDNKIKKRLDKDYDEEDEEVDLYNSNSKYPSITAWHNIMDSVSGEILFWFTTNRIDFLRKINMGSLIRKGRIDHVFEFDTITDNEVRLIVNKFSPHTNIDIVPEGLTIADIIANIKYNGEFIPNYSLS